MILVSDLHIDKTMRKTRERVARMAWDAVEYAKGRGLHVELWGQYASRADQQFLHYVFSHSVKRVQTGSASATRSGC
ncbi:MAG: hypothetical protein WCF90_01475 [Methanomicrobiales archaeon]